MRRAIADASGVTSVSTERKKQTKSVRRESVVYLDAKEKDGVMVLEKGEGGSTSKAPVPAVKNADVCLMEPVFVNPNSHEAIEILLRTIGESAGIKQYGGSDRCWLPVEGDGLPYT